MRFKERRWPEAKQSLIAASSKTLTYRKVSIEESSCQHNLQRAYFYLSRSPFIFLCCLNNFGHSMRYYSIWVFPSNLVSWKIQTKNEKDIRYLLWKRIKNIGYHLKYSVKQIKKCYNILNYEMTLILLLYQPMKNLKSIRPWVWLLLS